MDSGPVAYTSLYTICTALQQLFECPNIAKRCAKCKQQWLFNIAKLFGHLISNTVSDTVLRKVYFVMV